MLLLTPYVTNADGRSPLLPPDTPFHQWTDRASGACVWVERPRGEIQPWVARNQDVRVASMSPQEISEIEALHAALRNIRPVSVTKTRRDGSTFDVPEPPHRKKRGSAHSELVAVRAQYARPWIEEAKSAARADALRNIANVLLPLVIGIPLYGVAQYLAVRYGWNPGAMLPMLGTVLATDTFTGSDHDEVNGRSTETGGLTWATSPTLSVSFGNGLLEILSNTLHPLSAAQAFLTDATPISDQYMQVNCVGGRTGNFGVRANYSSTANCYYMSNTGGGAGRLRKIVAGADSLIASSSLSLTAAVYRVEAIGTAIDHYKAGVWDCGASDGSLSSGYGCCGALGASSLYDKDNAEWGDFASPAAEFPRKRYAFFSHIRR